MEVDLGYVALVSALVGFFAHFVWFVRGEHVTYAPSYVIIAFFGPPLCTAALMYYLHYTLLTAIASIFVSSVSFLATLFTSIAIYRVYLHPLRQFPGPPKARLSQFWWVSQTREKCDNFRLLNRLHDQYGPYVRVGPNLLSVADPDWVERIHNPQSKWEKADWYSTGHPMTTLHQMRDKAMHDARRKHGWDKAFTTKSLRSYDNRQKKYADQLVTQIRKRSGETVNATRWLNYFAFDVMGEVIRSQHVRTLLICVQVIWLLEDLSRP